MTIPEVIVFDLDSTLATSKQPIDAAMAKVLTALLTRARIAVISGGKLEQLATQVADQLPPEAALKKLYLLPTSGAALYTHKEHFWQAVYQEQIPNEELERIGAAIRAANDQCHVVDFSETSYGERIEFRGAQVSLSALGQQAPIEKKQAWDPDRTKREKLQKILAPLLPAYEVRIGGTTTIDITKKGIDKAYGVRQLSNFLSIPINHMLYVGDELGADGNDEVVIQTGIPTRAVTNPDDTRAFLAELLA